MSKEKVIESRFKVKINNWFDNIITEALKNEPAPKLNANNGKPSKTKSRLLLEFFQKHRAEVLAFAFDKSMPFSNNLAEQSFRHVKTKMKVIGGFRLIEGAKTYARCQAVMDTWRKSGQYTPDEIRLLIELSSLITKNIGRQFPELLENFNEKITDKANVIISEKINFNQEYEKICEEMGLC